METSLRQRILVGIFATVAIVGSGVATALVTSQDGPTVGEAVDTTASTGDTVGSTVPTTPGSTIATTPGGADASKVGDGETDDVARFWDAAECGGDEVMNHGQYVSSQPKGADSRSTAAHSDCGKPLTSLGESGDNGDEGDAGDASEVDTPDGDGGHAPSGAPGKSGSAPGHNK